MISNNQICCAINLQQQQLSQSAIKAPQPKTRVNFDMDSRIFSFGLHMPLQTPGIDWSALNWKLHEEEQILQMQHLCTWNPCDKPKCFYQPEPHSATKIASPFIPEKQEVTSKCSESAVTLQGCAFKTRHLVWVWKIFGL